MYISNILMVMGGLATLGSAFQNPIRRPGADPSMVVVDNVCKYISGSLNL
jgi:hypothetical protein